MRHEKFSNVGKVVSELDVRKSKRKINLIVMHCTATKPETKFGAKECDVEHMRRWGKRSGCGYHYIIRKDGTLELGRDVDYMGAHVKGLNRNSIGIAYEGGLDKEGKPKILGMTIEQSYTMFNLMTQIKLFSDIEIDIKGHGELPFVNKACPCEDMNRVRKNVDCEIGLAMTMF